MGSSSFSNMDVIGKRYRRECQSEQLDMSTRNHIADMIKCKKGELSRKLFIAVNQQSISTLMATSFEKPKPLCPYVESGENISKRMSSIYGIQDISNQACQKPKFSDRIEIVIIQAGRMINKFEEAYAKNATISGQTQLNELNSYILHALLSSFKAKPKVSSKLSSATSEELAVAILTLSSKKVRLSKCSFVDLVQIFWPTTRETILTKSTSYYFLVWLLSRKHSSPKNKL